MNNLKQADVTRRNLIEAAIDLLIERGVARVTFVEVARKAGLTRGAVHHHFADRIALLDAIIDHIGVQLLEKVRASALGALPPDEPRKLIDMIDFAWEQLNSREFHAYQQILVGLGAERENATHIAAKMRGITTAWTNTANRVTHNDKHPALARVMLAAISGAASIRSTVGAPEEDPEFEAFLNEVRSLIALAEADR